MNKLAIMLLLCAGCAAPAPPAKPARQQVSEAPPVLVFGVTNYHWYAGRWSELQGKSP